ncbi:MAG: hypothetical protein VB049_08405 [Candidatus Pelethousia sp.]|nr:hypothetical protein [Candidatus Pelethousia sp.]
MFCCLLEIKKLGEPMQAEALERLVKRYLTPMDQTSRICRERMLVVTALESYAEVKEKIVCLAGRLNAQYQHLFELRCGFAEMKDADLLSAIQAARQLLEQTNGHAAISGMYYYKFRSL